METGLKHVSDTALMVAAARALETDRADRLSSDPFARTLAGSRGEDLVKQMPNPFWMAFGMGIRTKFVDEFLLYEIGTREVECIINLGAGLDTRPWRLNLLPGLRWIEGDFTGMLDYKHSVLAQEQPRCHLERVNLDLNEASSRTKVWASVAPQRTVLLTEGLLMYLPAETVRSMAEEAGSAGVNTWILDLNSRALMRVVHADQASTIDSLRASTHLEPSEIQEVLKDTGWELLDEKRYIRDGGRYALTRMQREGMQPDPNAERIPEDDPGGVAVYRRRPA